MLLLQSGIVIGSPKIGSELLLASCVTAVATIVRVRSTSAGVVGVGAAYGAVLQFATLGRQQKSFHIHIYEYTVTTSFINEISSRIIHTKFVIKIKR